MKEQIRIVVPPVPGKELDTVSHQNIKGDIVLILDYKDRKRGYCERTKEFILQANPQYKTWEECPMFIIDYPLEKTISVMFPKSVKKILTAPENLTKENVELRLIKPVKNGTIVSYHYND